MGEPAAGVGREQPRIALVGPGAIGSCVAGALAAAGHDVLLCGRRALPEIVVRENGEETMRIEGPVRTDPAGLGPVPWVLLAVKAHQTPGAAAWLECLADAGTTIVVLQNGIEQRALAEPFAGGAAIVPSIVWIPAEVVAPGEVELRGPLRLILPAGQGDAAADLLDGTRCEIERAADFAAQAWYKLAVNAVAAFTVLAHGRVGIFRREDIGALTAAYVEEIAAVAAAVGVELPPTAAEDVLADLRAMPPDLGSSITFAVEAGQSLEWEARNGIISRLGREHGVATPISDVVVPLLATASG